MEEVPAPGCQPGGVLVRTAASLISSGTERATVKLGGMSLLGKAMERPDLVKSLFQRLRTTGRRERRRHRARQAGPGDGPGLQRGGGNPGGGRGRARSSEVGQRVACAGMGYASHAERIWVPRNLCVPIPENVDYDSAAFVALGSIALQGVRVAEVKIGEHVAVLGLGLVGLVTAQILQAAGCTVWGVDPDPDRVALARELGVAFATSEFRVHLRRRPAQGGRARTRSLSLRRRSPTSPSTWPGRSLATGGLSWSSGTFASMCPASITTRRNCRCGTRAPTVPAAMTRPTRKKELITRRVTCAGRRRETCRPSWTWWPPGRLTLPGW